MYHNIGSAIDSFIKTSIILLVISIPLAVWKIVEIILWVYNHISIQLN